MKKLSLSVNVVARSGGAKIVAKVGDWQYFLDVRGGVKQWPIPQVEKFVRSNPQHFHPYTFINGEQPPFVDIVWILWGWSKQRRGFPCGLRE